MHSAVETLTPTRVRLTVEVPFDELTPSVDAAYKKIGQQVRVQGFRPGKVPPRILDQRVGRGAVLEEAVQDAVPRFYSDAVRENDMAVLGSPEVEVTSFADGGQLVFTAEVDVRPPVTLPSFEDISVTVDDVDVPDSDVDEQLDGLRDRFATLTPVDRPAAEGDYVTLDLTSAVDGEPVPGGDANGLSYEVGTEGLLPGLDAAITGAAVGEGRKFETELVAGEFAGSTATVTAVVQSVKTKSLPEADDDFARTASEFDSVEELRSNIRERLDRVRRLQQGLQARDAALDVLLSRTELPLPDAVVEAEVRWRRAAMQQQLDSASTTLEDYLETEGQSAEDFERDLQASAAEAVKAQFVLDAVADVEEVGVNDAELTEYVVRRAQRMDVDPNDYAESVVSGGQLPGLVAEVRRAKALAIVLQSATVTDASGRPVDVESAGQAAASQAATAEPGTSDTASVGTAPARPPGPADVTIR